MSTKRQLFRGWWSDYLRPDPDTAAARALRARLRRADTVLDVLAEESVHRLAATMPWLRSQPEVLAQIATTLAQIENDGGGPLARRLGNGDPRALSPLRFERLMRSSRQELPSALRRALPMAEYRCDVETLARDILYWGEEDEKTRKKWWFDYYQTNHNDNP